MSTTNLRESTIPQSYKCAVETAAPSFVNKITGEEIKVQLSLNPAPRSHFNSSVDCFANVIKTCADIMSTSFFKCKAKAALVFQKETGEFISACVSDYDADGENYFYNITFDPADIKNISKDKLVNYTDFKDEERNMTYWEIFNNTLCKTYNYAISDEKMIYTLTIQAFETLYHWFDVNAKTDEIVELIIDGYIGVYNDQMSDEEYNNSLVVVATGSVEVVKDVKNISIQFGEEMKAIAKGSNDMNS